MFFPIKKHEINNAGIAGGVFGGVDYDNGINVGLYKTEIPAISGSSSWINGTYFIPESYKNTFTDYKPTTINDLWQWTAPQGGIYYCQTWGANGRGTTGIFVNGNLVATIGNRNATDTETTVILNSGDILNILDLTHLLSTGEVATFNTLEEIKSKYPDTLYQQGYNLGQGPIFIFSRFFSFKESSGNTVENNSANGIYYRKHSDGFLEMWSKISDETVGNKTINFPINFIDDNYSVNTSISNGRRDTGSFVYVDKTTVSGMTIYVSSISTVRWKAEGYWK